MLEGFEKAVSTAGVNPQAEASTSDISLCLFSSNSLEYDLMLDSDLWSETRIICLASKLEWSRTVTAVVLMEWFVYCLDKPTVFDSFFMKLPIVFFPIRLSFSSTSHLGRCHRNSRSGCNLERYNSKDFTGYKGPGFSYTRPSMVASNGSSFSLWFLSSSSIALCIYLLFCASTAICKRVFRLFSQIFPASSYEEEHNIKHALILKSFRRIQVK